MPRLSQGGIGLSGDPGLVISTEVMEAVMAAMTHASAFEMAVCIRSHHRLDSSHAAAVRQRMSCMVHIRRATVCEILDAMPESADSEAELRAGVHRITACLRAEITQRPPFCPYEC